MSESSANEPRRIAATLLHDVGKYVARTARNVRAGMVVEGRLHEMLLEDVFETWRGTRASVRFEQLARELADAGVRDPRIDVARACLLAIDAREDAARSGNRDALHAIVTDARAIEDALRALARELASGPRASGPVSSGPVSSGPVSSGPVSSGPVSSGEADGEAEG